MGNLQAHDTTFERKKVSVVTEYVANILCPCLESNDGQQAYDLLL